MLIALHKNARTTPAVRAEIAASNEPANVLALRFGITEQTVYKWKKRVELTHFRGHIILCVQGVANVKSTTAVPGGIPPADGRAGSSRALTLAALS